jgi:hypothetical protein
MRPRALLRRLVLPPIAAGLAVSGLALPARADTIAGFPVVLLDITDSVTVIDGQSKTVKFDIFNFGSADAKNVVIGFGTAAAPVKADLGFVPPEGCSATACKLEKLPAGERHSYTFTLKPDVTSTTNLSSSLTVTSAVAGQQMDAAEVRVVRTTKSGVDLEVGALKDRKLGRGQSAEVPVIIRNTGNATSGKLGVIVAALDGVDPVMNYRNCEKDAEVGGVVCLVDQTLAAGETATLSPATPVKFRVGDDTPGPAQYFAEVAVVGLTDKYAAAFTKRAANRTGPELELTKAVSAAGLTDGDVDDDLNPEDNLAAFLVTVPKSAADSKALGGTFQGTAGDLVTVEVGTQNLGPTAAIPVNAKWIAYVHVKLPGDVKLTKVDEMCLPGTAPDKLDFGGSLNSRDWVCLVLDQLPKGGKSLFAFTAMIQEGSHEAGFVQVSGGLQDTNHSNDKTALTVKDSGGLAITGPSAGLLAAGGAGLLVVGVIAFRMARRRRIITVV